ncbi:hypothetical protein IJ380_03235 [Candidatus Saccharibacteria bacterium]|nr:hypothetical protein [Candidatus Saccharibacteria bacterium]
MAFKKHSFEFYKKVFGVFLAVFVLSVFFGGAAFAAQGGTGSGAPGGNCPKEGEPGYDTRTCYSGGGWAYYTFNDGVTTDVSVGGTTVSSVCAEYGGFYFFHWRHTTVNGRTNTNTLYGAKGASGIGDTSTAVKGVESSAYNSSQVTVQGYGYSKAQIETAYGEYLRNARPEDYAISWEAFISSSNTWFCYGEKREPVLTNTTGYVTPSVWPENTASYDTTDADGNRYYTFSSTGYKTLYSQFKISRTDYSAPNPAVMAYKTMEPHETTWTNETAQVSQATYGAQVRGIDSTTISVDWDDSYTRYCAYALVGNSNYSDGVWQSYTWQTSSSSDCIYVRGPRSIYATFDGSIAISPDSSLSGNIVVNSTSNTLEGSGLKTRYYFDTTYKVTRTNDTPEFASSDFAYGTWITWPTSGTNNTGNLSKDQYAQINTYGPVNYYIDVPIGGTSNPFCFRLIYDQNVKYHGTTLADGGRDFSGKRETCITISNPGRSYNTTFSGTTRGWLNAHDRLELSSCDGEEHCLDGRINNTTRNADGSFSDAYPASDRYTATFIHTLQRTDANNPTFTLPTDTGTLWEVQAKVDNGSYSVVTSGSYNNPAFTNTVGTNVEVYNQANVLAAILNSGNKGKYATYCQRLHYYNTVSYQTASDASNLSSYQVVRNTPTGEVYTTPVCVTIKNPSWEEKDTPDWGTPSSEQQNEKTARTHNINVTGETTGISFRNDSAVNVGGENWVAKKVDVLAYFDHSLTRRDSGFDESDATTFYPTRGTMYSSFANASGSPFTVSTNFHGRESILGRADELDISPLPNRRTPVNPYGLNNFFYATEKNSNVHWDSSMNTGRTYTPFNVSASRDLYTLRAGGSTRVCQTTYNTRTAWQVRYKDVLRREVYYDESGNLISGMTTEWTYDRTELVSSRAEEVEPVAYISSPKCLNIRRDWNFEVVSAEPNNVENIHSSAQSISSTFTIGVQRDSGYNDGIYREFITDVDSEIYTIAFVVHEGANDAANHDNLVQATAGGIYNAISSPADFCNFYAGYGILDVNLVGGAQACRIIIPGSGNEKVRGHNSTTASDGVWTLDSYNDVTFTTGDIPVPTIPVGDKFCLAVGIRTRSSTSNQSFISRSTCTNLSKRPAFHVWGGNVETAGGIKTSLTQIQDETGTRKSYGSWGDLAIIANKPVTRMSSGDAIVEHFADANLYIPCSVSPLTIANKQCETTMTSKTGEAAVSGASSIIDKIIARYSKGNTTYEGGAATAITIDDAFFANPDVFAKLSISDSDRIEGVEPLVIYAHGNVTIATNIKLNPNMRYSGVHVPQVIIVAEGNVNIAENVDRVDAWILARGSLDTCTTASGENIQLSSKVCSTALRLNGPVIASKINLKRTFGADLYEDLRLGTGEGNLKAPAELINFSPAAYLFGVNESQKSGQPRVTYLRELAPRY